MTSQGKGEKGMSLLKSVPIGTVVSIVMILIGGVSGYTTLRITVSQLQSQIAELEEEDKLFESLNEQARSSRQAIKDRLLRLELGVRGSGPR